MGDLKEAPSYFQRKLRDIDPGLSAHWNRIRCIWQIWGTSRREGQAIVMHVCIGDATTGTFATLDGRVFQTLRQYDGRSRNVMDEMAESNIENVAKHDDEVEATDREFIEEEMQPRLEHDLNTEVSHSHSGVSVGAINIPKEDVNKMVANRTRRGRFGARPAPMHLARQAVATEQELDIEIEVEV